MLFYQKSRLTRQYCFKKCRHLTLLRERERERERERLAESRRTPVVQEGGIENGKEKDYFMPNIQSG